MPEVSPADLVSPLGLALQAASGAAGEDALAVVERLRAEFPLADPALVSAAVTQARLRDRAVERLGPLAQSFVLSDAGLQQATRWEVARYRAGALKSRLDDSTRRSAPWRLADLGCGLGVDAWAFAQAGFAVTAYESDPWTAAAATLNLGGQATVVPSDVRQLDDIAAGTDIAFVDPARRDPSGPHNAGGTRTRAQTNAEKWSPPWSWVVALSQHLPVVAKAAPSLRASMVPAQAEVEWIAHGGDLVEACVWFAPLGGPARRRATVIVGDSAHSLADTDGDDGSYADQAARFLLEPSPAVVRANLVDALSARLGAHRIGSAWLTSDRPSDSVLARTWRVMRPLPRGAKEQRDALRAAGSVTWKTADTKVGADAAAAKVGHRAATGGAAATVVLLSDGRAYEVESVAAQAP